MANVDEVKAAIEAEKAEVRARVESLEQQVRDLIANGAATPEQLEELLVGVQNIFTPPA